MKPYWSSIASVIYLQSISHLSTNFYQHGDMDMLEVGNSGQGSPVGNLTLAEQRSHFTAWALSKSHLLIGTDLRNATNDTIAVLGNKELIEINQDPNEGAAIAPFRVGMQDDFSYVTYNESYPPPYWGKSSSCTEWSDSLSLTVHHIGGNSSYGQVFMIINTMDQTQTMGFNLTENWAIRAGRKYNVRDLWKHEHVGVAVR